MTKRNRLAAGGLAALCCAAAGIGLSQAVGSSDSKPVAALNRSAQPGDALAQPDRSFLQSALPGVNVDGARKANLPDSPVGVWVVPSTERTCIVTTGPVTCPETAALLSDGIAAGYSWSLGQPLLLFGAAKNGVDSIRVTLDTGATVTAPVRDNAFSIGIESGSPTSLAWTDRDGNHTTKSPIDPATAAEHRKAEEQSS